MAEFLADGLAEVARSGGSERQAPKHLQVQHGAMAPNFRHDLRSEVRNGVLPMDYSVTSSMRQLHAPSGMLVKSGYGGHVPQSRDFIGGSYRTMANRGVPGKEPPNRGQKAAEGTGAWYR